MSIYSISVIIPIYNEEEILESSLLKNLHVLNSRKIDYEIIIVNDGSSDNCRNILIDLKKSTKIKVFEHENNLGLGAAIRTGIKYSEKDYILCVPADSPLELDSFQSFESCLGAADVLVSYRLSRLGYTWWMSLNSIIYHRLISLLFGMKLKDYNWIHLYNRKIFSEGKIEIEYNGIFMLAEVLIKSRDLSYTFIEFPVNQTQRITGEASAAKFKNIIKTTKDAFHYFLQKRYSKI